MKLKVLILMILVMAGCTPTPAPSPTFKAPQKPSIARPEADADKLKALIEKLNGFSVALYTDLTKQRQGNLAVSPLGSFLLLQLLLEGSAGAAHQQLKEKVGSAAGMEEVGQLVWDLNSLESLEVAQKIYVDNGAKILDSYLQQIHEVLDNPVETVPFASNPVSAKKTIGEWVAKKTGGLLNQDIGNISQLTTCVLVSTLHFQGRWDEPFPVGDTKEADFHLSGETTMKVAMMRLEEEALGLFTIPGGQAVRLPYVGPTEMIVMLPDKGVSPDQLWDDLDPKVRLGKYPPSNLLVTVELPRFEFRVPTFEITQGWRGMGLESVLHHPDLSPMLKLDKPVSQELRAYHQTYIKVDEIGTEAAASTTLIPSASPGMMEPPKVKVIRFDRPFSFLLRHTRTGAALMMGRVERPTPWTQ